MISAFYKFDLSQWLSFTLRAGVKTYLCTSVLCRGVNGAGKTTTLSILSGDIKPTSGDAFITGNSVLSELAAAQKQIGYCPQFNPLLDFMTAREHLHLYASLKGVPSQDIATVITELVEAVGLENYVDKVAGSYSGGNKRKLALSIALVSSRFSLLAHQSWKDSTVVSLNAELCHCDSYFSRKIFIFHLFFLSNSDQKGALW
jgi:ABC-type multidrug transport system ATPase subunit